MVRDVDEFVETHRQELRRGTVVLACLALLSEHGHGYGLLDALRSHGFPVDANTLYPLLRRLEKQGYLTAEWNTDEARPRKLYRTSEAGRALVGTLTDEFDRIAGAVAALPKEK